MYSYNTPEEAIISLERAYQNCDLNAVMVSKDFEEEAKLLLSRTQHNYDINDAELVYETAELLKLTLTQGLIENGYPDFTDAIREFSAVQEIERGLYFVQEKLSYPDGTCYINDILLTYKNKLWKVATVKE